MVPGEKHMSCTVDMALDTGEERTAAALHVALSGMDVFLLFEVESAVSPQQHLLPVALSAVVGSLSVPAGSSPERNLETALKAANRAVHEARLQNPAAGECLVSAVVASRKEGRIAASGAGANAAYLRTPGETRPLFVAETVSAKLIEDGITSELTDENAGEGAAPTNGLGVAPEMFEVKQSMTVDEPPRCELVLCGAAMAARVGPAHMKNMPVATPVHDTARRLYRVYWSKKGKGSGVLAAQCRAGVEASLGDAGDFERPAPTIPWAWFWLAGLAIAALAAAFLFYSPDETQKRTRQGEIPPASSLLPSKPEEPTNQPVAAGLSDVSVAPDRVALPADAKAVGVPAAAADAATQTKSKDATSDGRDLKAAEIHKKEKPKPPRRKKKRKSRRKKKTPKPVPEKASDEVGSEPSPGGPAVVRDPDFPDVTIQVMDFARPQDVREQASDTGPERPGFPMAKEFPDVRAEPEKDSRSAKETVEVQPIDPDVSTEDVTPLSGATAPEIVSSPEDVVTGPPSAEPEAVAEEVVTEEEF